MKLEEITNKERFVNVLKDPKLEEVRVGLEKLVHIFNDKGWKLETKLEDGIYWIYVTQDPLVSPVKNNMFPLNHMGTLGTMFSNKYIIRHLEEEDKHTFVYSINVYKDFKSEKPWIPQ